MISTRWMQLNRNPWLDEPIPYGFGFALLTRALATVGNGNLWLTFWLFDLVNLLVHAAVAWLLWSTAHLIPGAEPKLVLYLYSWSPLVVLQYLADVHNDIIMAGLIVLAFYFLFTGRYLFSMPALVAAGFIKVRRVCAATVHDDQDQRAPRMEKRAEIHRVVVAARSRDQHSIHLGRRSLKAERLIAQLTESPGSLHAFLLFSYRAAGPLLAIEHENLDTLSTSVKFILWAIVELHDLSDEECLAFPQIDAGGSRHPLDLGSFCGCLRRKLTVLRVVHRDNISVIIAGCRREPADGSCGSTLMHAHGVQLPPG